MPALLNRTSSRPHLDLISLKTALTSASFGQVRRQHHGAVLAPDSAAVFSSMSLRRPTSPTL
jgi:hypothetical protein